MEGTAPSEEPEDQALVARAIEIALSTQKPDFARRPDLSEPLVALAEQLASDDAPEREAIYTLRAAASGRSETLADAAGYVRFLGTIEEKRSDFRSFRLLIAAASNVVPPPIDPTLDAFHDQIARLVMMGPETAFETLRASNPELDTVVSEAVKSVAGGADPDDIWDETMDALSRVVGPWSDAKGDVARSLTAQGMCRLHIASRIGFRLDPP